MRINRRSELLEHADAILGRARKTLRENRFRAKGLCEETKEKKLAKIEGAKNVIRQLASAVNDLESMGKKLIVIQQDLNALEQKEGLSKTRLRPLVKEQFERIDKFPIKPTKQNYRDEYPYGRNRGYVRQITTYDFTGIGTDKAKEELKKRYESKKALSYPFSQYEKLTEFPKEGITRIEVIYTIDTTD